MTSIEIQPVRRSGTFRVKVTPLPAEPGIGDASIGRMSLHKVFEGDLDGEAHGQMLAAMTGVAGSAAYVALDRFEGSLDGRRGGFSLQHRGIMDRGAPELSVTIVPDSGTGELEGISGSLGIRISDGAHFYDLDYRLP
jgi:hypothetical protein